MYPDVYTEDGVRKTSPEYRSWQMMKNRCLNPNAEDYHHYGGRGINICDTWLLFEGFLADMGRRPAESLTLDRINNNLGYNKANCRWASRKTQAQNRDYCELDQTKANKIRRLYADGALQRELAEIFGVCQRTISLVVRGEAWCE